MTTMTLAVAGGRAALLSGLVPLLLLAGLMLLVLAAPASKDRITELKARFGQLSGSLPEPVRTYLGTDVGAEPQAAESGWRTSDPEQFSEFYTQLVDGTDAGPDPAPGARPGTRPGP
jgi:hypothetical protein